MVSAGGTVGETRCRAWGGRPGGRDRCVLGVGVPAPGWSGVVRGCLWCLCGGGHEPVFAELLEVAGEVDERPFAADGV